MPEERWNGEKLAGVKFGMLGVNRASKNLLCLDLVRAKSDAKFLVFLWQVSC